MLQKTHVGSKEQGMIAYRHSLPRFVDEWTSQLVSYETGKRIYCSGKLLPNIRALAFQ